MQKIKTDLTVTVYIVKENKVLMIKHQKYGKWTAPGGHMEEGETPLEAARREVMEEAGLEIEFQSDENVWVTEIDATSVPRPYSVMLFNLPAMKGEPAHDHFDFIYLAKPVKQIRPPDDEVRWFTSDEIAALKPNEEIFPDTQIVVAKLFNTPKSCCAV